MRSDKAKNTAKVVKEIVKNPLKSQREIAKDTGLGLSSVNRARQEMEQNGTKDDRIVGICDKDLDIVTLGQEIIHKRLKNKREVKKMRTSEISSVIKENTARYTLFKGDVTDKDGGLKQPDVVFQIVDPNQEND